MEKKIEGFGERLKRLRKEKKLTMQAIANKMGKGKSTYAGWELEVRKPDIVDLQVLTTILNTSMDYLCGLTENPAPKDPSSNLREIMQTVPSMTWDGQPLDRSCLDLIKQTIKVVLDQKRVG